LNCSVIGPQSRPYFRIMTDTPMPGVSVFQNSNGQNIALVQWHRHPEVELRNIVARQRVSEMLSLSPDQRLWFCSRLRSIFYLTISHPALEEWRSMGPRSRWRREIILYGYDSVLIHWNRCPTSHRFIPPVRSRSCSAESPEDGMQLPWSLRARPSISAS
jgi:hypothetical protein